MSERELAFVAVRTTPSPVVFWIVPPVHVGAATCRSPSFRSPSGRVHAFVRLIPFVAPFDETLWNVTCSCRRS